MGLEIILIWLVLFSFVLAIGLPMYFVLNALYMRPKGKVSGFKTRQKAVSGYFSPDETGEALATFQRIWNENISQQQLKPILDKLNIFWKSEPIKLGQSYTINGKKISMASGLTRTKKDIDVWIYDKDKEKQEVKISGTALVHEIIHIVLWNTEGDPDADHEDSLYKGWTSKHTEVERLVNMELKNKGL